MITFAGSPFCKPGLCCGNDLITLKASLSKFLSTPLKTFSSVTFPFLSIMY